MYNALEDVLEALLPLKDAIVSTFPMNPDEQRLYERLFSSPEMQRISYATTSLNYLAWDAIAEYQPSIASDSGWKFYDDAHVVWDGAYLMARAALEKSRATGADLLERPFAEVVAEVGEVRLPLSLGAAVSRIDRAQQLPHILQQMSHQAERFRRRFSALERTIADPFRRGAAREIRLLHEDLKQSARKAAGTFLTAPTTLQGVAAWASISRTRIISDVLEYARFLFKPELRLLAHWTREQAMDTVGKVRILFRTSGSETDWNLAADTLLKVGTVAWYPLRTKLEVPPQ